MPGSSSRTALLSVTDKTGIVSFAQGLLRQGYRIVSTGGTARLLREHAVEVTDVSSLTGHPEILDGRVKSLHPKIHGGLLYDRNNPTHEREVADYRISSIDLVCVNLYRFEEKGQSLPPEEALEFIDVGGPTMLRAAAKNWPNVLPICDPGDYDRILKTLESGPVPSDARLELAAKTFRTLSRYDQAIAGAFEAASQKAPASEAKTVPSDDSPFVATVTEEWTRTVALRYGENPAQKAALYTAGPNNPWQSSFDEPPEQLQGKELSYNNLLDLDAATALVADFSEGPAAAVFKHTNPAGCAFSVDEGTPLAELYRKAYEGDPKSAFGGIVGLNRPCDPRTAEALTAIFLECVAAPEFTREALEILARKPNLRVLKAPWINNQTPRQRIAMRSLGFGMLMQTADLGAERADDWKTVTKVAPDEATRTDLVFAMRVAKHVKSNAIVYAKEGRTVAIGAGQMSRIDAAQFAAEKAKAEGRDVNGSVLASDAFFPFRDTVDIAAKWGVRAIVQPGGSKRDEESITAADEHGLAMMVTGKRHFRH